MPQNFLQSFRGRGPRQTILIGVPEPPSETLSLLHFSNNSFDHFIKNVMNLVSLPQKITKRGLNRFWGKTLVLLSAAQKLLFNVVWTVMMICVISQQQIRSYWWSGASWVVAPRNKGHVALTSRPLHHEPSTCVVPLISGRFIIQLDAASCDLTLILSVYKDVHDNGADVYGP